MPSKAFIWIVLSLLAQLTCAKSIFFFFVTKFKLESRLQCGYEPLVCPGGAPLSYQKEALDCAYEPCKPPLSTVPPSPTPKPIPTAAPVRIIQAYNFSIPPAPIRKKRRRAGLSDPPM
ncbi:unnamed protein product [Aphanomyces euteiches]|uniref:Uncharacterized protein n=1 Tax=Aphanomyces euteiches TaxID=100861 RepID=A0A6G0W7R6_9STRA|nr:hypothetical protein Ae201684_018639 [Aphanomyces euteiches]KAH9071830.1 hypothetical protein Ae201684P_020089 [Aphanomyces euteiches]KAH9156340.1 hypothetical protein AeRB84_001733 [Aphanomyces euteiches]